MFNSYRLLGSYRRAVQWRRADNSMAWRTETTSVSTASRAIGYGTGSDGHELSGSQLTIKEQAVAPAPHRADPSPYSPDTRQAKLLNEAFAGRYWGAGDP